MGRGEVSPAACVEQILDSVIIEEERIAPAAGEDGMGPRLHDIGLGPEGDFGIADDLLPDGLGRPGFRALCQEHAHGLTAVLRLRVDEAEGEVRQAVPVAVDVEAIDRIGMERVRGRIGVQDQYCPRWIRRRLEGIEVAEVEPLVAERRAKTKSGEMVRHFALHSDWGKILGAQT